MVSYIKQIILGNINNVCTQLNVFKYFSRLLIILSNIYHLFAHSEMVSSTAIDHQ